MPKELLMFPREGEPRLGPVKSRDERTNDASTCGDDEVPTIPAKTLCKGCQDFVDAVCHSGDPIDFNRLPGWEIHDSYMDLSTCADLVCGLCAFLRRELWFSWQWEGTGRDTSKYVFRDVISASDTTMRIIPCFGKSKLSWQLVCGRTSGALRSFGRVHNDRRSSEEESRTGKNRGDHPSLDDLLQAAREWLATCQLGQKHCNNSSSNDPPYPPTRLRDIGLSNQGLVRLVDSSSLRDETDLNYVTLSYRWGKSNHAARTTEDTLDQRMNAIPMATLPQTIQDAVLVTRTGNLKIDRERLSSRSVHAQLGA